MGATIAFGYGNLTDSSTLSGGSWEASQGLSKLKDRALAEYAQTTDISSSSTEIRFDHQTPKEAQLFGVFASNTPDGSSIRILRSDVTPGAGEILDTGTLTCWPFTPMDGVNGNKFPIMVMADNPTTARYTAIKMTIASGSYWRLGRPFVGPMFIPEIGASELVDDWLPSFSTITRTDNGTDWAFKRANIKSAKILYKRLREADSSLLHEIHRTHDITDEVVYYPYIQGRAAAQQYGFLGTLRNLSPLGTDMVLIRDMYVTIDQRGGAP